MEILRKVTLRTAGLDIKGIKAATLAAGAGVNVPLLKIVGETTEAKTGQTDKGEFTALLGDFVAVNLLTGEQFQSGKAILPNFISEVMRAALNASQSVTFALEIGAEADDTALTGYVYTTRSLVDAEPTDKMRRLLAAAKIDTAQSLPAPAEDKPAEDKPTTGKGKGKGK